ncbi:MAG: YkgJ family cysteine cluster protein [Myxococcales bacterium]|nr:YkgJ family cysteine cluster protein [Myxococcales bacterium]
MSDSMAEKFARPVWRSFTQKYLSNAAEWVRSGGCAVVWRPAKGGPAAWLLLPLDDEGGDDAMPEPAYWAMLAVYLERYTRIARGAAKGLATVRVARDYEHEVEHWCERDSKYREPTRELELDCTTCAACCIKNRVVLDDADLARLAGTDRPELTKKPYVRTDKGVKLLALDKTTGACVHLNNKLCGIYERRPDNCRWFPAATEPCLIARREEFGWED